MLKNLNIVAKALMLATLSFGASAGTSYAENIDGANDARTSGFFVTLTPEIFVGKFKGSFSAAPLAGCIDNKCTEFAAKGEPANTTFSALTTILRDVKDKSTKKAMVDKFGGNYSKFGELASNNAAFGGTLSVGYNFASAIRATGSISMYPAKKATLFMLGLYCAPTFGAENNFVPYIGFNAGLGRLAKQDGSFKIALNEETNTALLSGLPRTLKNTDISAAIKNADSLESVSSLSGSSFVIAPEAGIDFRSGNFAIGVSVKYIVGLRGKVVETMTFTKEGSASKVTFNPQDKVKLNGFVPGIRLSYVF